MSLRKHRARFALLALLASPLSALAAPLYSATFLPLDFYGEGINNAGQIVGTAGGGAAIWSSPSSMLSLGSLLPGSEGLGINNHGDIVGRYGSDAFVYAGGVATSIATGTRSWATGINDAGQVTGTASADTLGGVQSGFLYANGTTTWFSPDYPMSGGNFSNAINNAGTVVGTLIVGGHWSNPDRQAFVLTPPGPGYLFGQGTLGGTISEGLDINDAGAFVGWSTNYDDNRELAIIGSPGHGLLDLGSLGGVSSRALGLNNLGMVVGMSDIGGANGSDYHAFLYDGHGMLDLNSLVAPMAGWTLVRARDINDAGQILAEACRTSGETCQFVRLDMAPAVPEPTTWGMLLAGLGLLSRAARRQRRRLAACAVPALLAVPVAAHADNAATFTITAVPTGFSANAINNAGQIVGTWEDAQGQVAAIWDGKNITTLSRLAPGSTGLGINDRGHVVGRWHAEAFISTPAGVRDLGRFGTWPQSSGDAVNNAGDVAGNASWGLGEEWRGWVNSRGIQRMIGTFGGDWSEARAINSAGQVVGVASLQPFRGPFSDTRAFVYRDRMLVDLGTLGAGISSSANDINDAGQIVGASEYTYNPDGSGPSHPFLYENRQMRDLGTLGGPDGAASGINNAGAVVGYTMLGADDFTTHAFLWENGRMRDLNGLARMPTGWILVGARDINDRRQILASACQNEDCITVRLDPIAPK